MGRKNRAFYRIVAVDATVKPKGEYIENLGWYDPLLKDENSKINTDAAQRWLSVGAQPSNTVAVLLKKSGVALPERKKRPDRRNRGKK